MSYQIRISEDAYLRFKRLDKSIKSKIIKAIEDLKVKDSGKRLKGYSSFIVKKVGQYRIVYVVDNKNKIKIIYFIGDHKEYEKWYTHI